MQENLTKINRQKYDLSRNVKTMPYFLRSLTILRQKLWKSELNYLIKMMCWKSLGQSWSLESYKFFPCNFFSSDFWPWLLGVFIKKFLFLLKYNCLAETVKISSPILVLYFRQICVCLLFKLKERAAQWSIV